MTSKEAEDAGALVPDAVVRSADYRILFDATYGSVLRGLALRIGHLDLDHWVRWPKNTNGCSCGAPKNATELRNQTTGRCGDLHCSFCGAYLRYFDPG